MGLDNWAPLRIGYVTKKEDDVPCAMWRGGDELELTGPKTGNPNPGDEP